MTMQNHEDKIHILFICHGTTRFASLERRINWG